MLSYFKYHLHFIITEILFGAIQIYQNISGKFWRVVILQPDHLIDSFVALTYLGGKGGLRVQTTEIIFLFVAIL